MQPNRSSFKTHLRRAWLAVVLGTASLQALTPGEWAELQRKAESGDVTAMHYLGLRHAASKEEGADWIEACVWLTLAEERGIPDRALPQIRSQLTPDQLERAERRLSELRQRLGSPVSAAPGPVSAPETAPVRAAVTEERKLSDELADAWKEADRLKERVKEGESKVQDLLRQYEAAQNEWASERRDLLGKLGSGSEQVKALQDKVQQLVQVNQQLSTSLAETRMRVAEMNADLRQKATEDHSALDAARAQATAWENELKLAREKLAALEADLQRLREEATGAGTTLAKVQADLVAALDSETGQRKRVATLEQELASALERSSTLEREKASVEEQLGRAQSEVAALKGQNEESRGSKDEEKETFARRLAQLEAELSETKLRNDRLNVALIDANARASIGDHAVGELKALQGRLAEVERLREESAKAAALEQLRLAVDADRLRIALASRSSVDDVLTRLRKDLDDARLALALARAAELDRQAHFEAERQRLAARRTEARGLGSRP